MPRPQTARELGLMEATRRSAARALVTLDNWQDAPWNRWSFQHVGQIIPSARIRRGKGEVIDFDNHPADVDSVGFLSVDGGFTSLARLLDSTYTDGFLVLRRGRVVAEEYFNGMEPESRHLLQSISKSMTGALAGVLVERRLLDPQRLVTDYVPELAETSFAGATVRQVLDMTVGTRFSEQYDDSRSDVRLYEVAAGWRPLDGAASRLDLFDYIRRLKNQRRHGKVFQYRSIVTDLLAIILERAGCASYADLMSELIWQPLGAEHDAEVTVDRHGNPMADGGISVTLRDLGRFGQMILQRGCFNGRQIVPAHWVNDTRFADEACRQAFVHSDSAGAYPKGHYRNQWWVVDPAEGVLLAHGIYGQFLYIDISLNLVIAKLSSLPVPLDADVTADHLRAFAAIAIALSPLA